MLLKLFFVRFIKSCQEILQPFSELQVIQELNGYFHL